MSLITHASIAATVIDLYLANGGKAIRISEVAKAAGTTSKRVNDAIEITGIGLEWTEVEVSYRGAYGYDTRYKMSPAVQPSRSKLVQLIKDARKTASDAVAQQLRDKAASAPSFEQAREAFARGFRGLTQVNKSEAA